MAYLLDANVFIQAADRLYPMREFPGYWDWIRLQSAIGAFASVVAVKDELETPDLKAWADESSDMFRDPNDSVTEAFGEVAGWVNAQTRFYDTAKIDFLNGADGHLIADALANNDIVVTYEKSEPDSRKVVKIPDVCNALGVECLTPFVMLGRERPRFVLDATVRESLLASRHGSIGPENQQPLTSNTQ